MKPKTAEEELRGWLQEARDETARVRQQLKESIETVGALQYQLKIIREVLSVKV